MQKLIKYICNCNHLHIDRYDAINQLSKFEEILM